MIACVNLYKVYYTRRTYGSDNNAKNYVTTINTTINTLNTTIIKPLIKPLILTS